MANPTEYLTAIRKKYPTIKITEALNNELTRRAGQGATVDQVLADAAGYSEVEAGRKEYLDAARINPLTQEDQAGFFKSAEDLFAPLRGAASAKTTAGKAQNAATFADLETRLRERETSAQEGLRTDLSNRGFLRSGEQVGVGERIASETGRDINRADIARAIADADLVLQEATQNVDFSKAAQQYGQQLAQGEMGRRTSNAQAGLANIGLLGRELDNTLQQQGFDFNKVKSGQELLLNPDFEFLIEDQPDLARQLLQAYGFETGGA